MVHKVGNDLKYCLCCILFFYFWPEVAWCGQPDYLLEEQPHPSSAEDIKGPLSSSFPKEITKPLLFPVLKEKLQDLPPFFRDTHLNINFRTYDFDRDNSGFIDTDGSNDRRAWAVGGALNYQSGFLFDRLSLGATYYTSQKIVGPKNKEGTLLLESLQNGFDVLGQAHATFLVTDDINIKAYRQTFNLPYLNTRDSRMVPNTHEAYALSGIDVFDSVDFITGYVHKMKTRSIDEFIHMSEVAGLNGTDNGLAMTGLLYHPNDNFSIGAIDYYSFNFMNIFYAETNMLINLSDEIPLSLSAQYTNQKSVGDELDGDFNRDTGGIMASVSYRNAVLTAAGTVTSSDSDFRSPYGGPPSYLSIVIKNFFRAEEKAWLVGLSYDFRELGIPGLTAYTNYAEGYTPDTGSNASPDQNEWDVTVDYRPEFSLLEGLWFLYRHVSVDQDGPGEVDSVDNRFILNLEIPLL